jgi:hypothetical protein
MGRIRTEVLSHDPVSGIRELFHYNLDTEEITIETVQGSKQRKGSLDAIVELAKAGFNSMKSRTPWRGDGGMNHVGYIPLVILQQHPELMYDDKAIEKWLNSPDHSCFRSRPGRI